MAIPANWLDSSQPPSARAARLASHIALDHASGFEREVWQRLSSMMCWDAALFCAWTVRAIHSPVITDRFSMGNILTRDKYQHVFSVGNRRIANANALAGLPAGCFIGFVGPENAGANAAVVLRHVMIHTGGDYAAGNKNDCVLSAGHSIGWERLDLRPFFGVDANLNTNANTAMVWAPINGQMMV